MTTRFKLLFLWAAALLLSGCASLPDHPPTPPTTAITDVADTPLARIAAAAVPADTQGLSGFRLLPEGATAFNARIALMRRAQKSLDVQYYLLRGDDIGRQFMRELRDAAQRGVRVRLLVDDLYTAGDEDMLAGLAAFTNAEVRLFNPLPARAGSHSMRLLFSLHQFGRVNHRMHNKLLVADNSFALNGGRNIADEYFMHSEAANFIDLDILSSGPVVRELSSVFDSYWNSGHVYPIGSLVTPLPADEARRRFDALVAQASPNLPERPRDVLGRTPVGEQLDSGRLDQVFASAQVFADTPDKVAGVPSGGEGTTVTEKTVRVFATAREQVIIVSPYFIPGEHGMAIMKAVNASPEIGQIQVVTNSLGASDEPLVHSGYSRYRLEMLKAGVRIYELSPSLTRSSGKFGSFGSSGGRLHVKAAIIDQRRLLIGSMNLDPRSARLNTEINLAIDSRELAVSLSRLGMQSFESSAYRLRLAPDKEHIEWVEQTADGKQVVHTDEPDNNWLLRLKMWLLSAFVSETQL